MRNLLLFLTRYHYYFVFILLEAASLGLLIQDNYYQHSGFMNTSGRVTGMIHESFSGITSYFRLKEANELLVEENARLKEQLRNSWYAIPSSKDTIRDTLFRQKFAFVSARVVNITTHKQDNYFTLNRGSADGIRPGMGVISSQGVAGIVKEVSENFCTVMSVLHHKVLIPSMVSKYEEPGILRWDGDDNRYALLPNIPRHIKPVKGDTILTSGSSSIFPEGTLVGTVEEVINQQGKTFLDLKVRLSTDFRKLSFAYAVVYLFKEEQDALEKKTEHDQ